MSGGPFRDTLAPAIAEAERQLAELRQQRADLEQRYDLARMRLDSKVFESALPPVTPPPEPVDWPTARKAVMIGVLVGLFLWIPLLAGR